MATIIYNEHSLKDENYIYSEKDESDLSETTPYGTGKVLAEKAAWDFVSKLPENERFELVVLNPSNIIGPSYATENFASSNILKGIMSGSLKRIGLPAI